jgi:hypothetical protein
MLGSDQTKGKHMLRITSDRDTLTLHGLPFGETIEWLKGTHYAYCYNGGGHIVDEFSFAWEKNKTNMLDFMEAAQNFITYYFEENEYAGA